MINTTIEAVDIAGLRPGDDWSVTIPLTVAWLPGDTARMHVRDKVGSAVPLLRLSSIPTPGQGLITLTGEGLTFVVEDALTATVPFGPLVYDIEVTRGGQVETLFGGAISLSAKVTRGV